MMCADDGELASIEHTKWSNKLWQQSVVMYVGWTFILRRNIDTKIPNKNKKEMYKNVI